MFVVVFLCYLRPSPVSPMHIPPSPSLRVQSSRMIPAELWLSRPVLQDGHEAPGGSRSHRSPRIELHTWNSCACPEIKMFKAEIHCPAAPGLIVYVDARLAKEGLCSSSELQKPLARPEGMWFSHNGLPTHSSRIVTGQVIVLGWCQEKGWRLPDLESQQTRLASLAIRQGLKGTWKVACIFT